MGRYFFLMMSCGLLLAACDKDAEVKTSADANADLNAGATATANANDTPSPPANTGDDGTNTGSVNAPGLRCWTPAGLVNVQAGDTIMMIPGQGCDPKPSAAKLALPEGEASFISANFAPGPRLIYDPNKCNLKPDEERADCWSKEISCDPAAVKADVDFGKDLTVGLPFKVVPDGCKVDG